MLEVQYRSQDELESEADHLLDRFANSKRWVPTPPVPIEKLIIFLGLHQEVVDLYDYLGIIRDKQTDLLGALFFEESTIRVHSGIDPEDYPWLEGRFNFTLAHEVAHWVLHRDEYQTHARQGSLFEDPRPQQIICRRSEKSERIEIQANRFAGCLLMPRTLILEAWHKMFGSRSGMTSELKKRTIRTIAEQFCTSIEATGYRLEELGLFGANHSADLGV